MINRKSEEIYSKSVREDMFEFLPEEYSKILEVGCNVGNFREYFTKPCEYWGVEPYEQAAMQAKAKMDRVLADFYDNVKDEIPDNYFDLVIANDVIEHFENPWNFLTSVKEKMSANASIILSVPNVRYLGNLKDLLLKRDWKYTDDGILDITHLRFFTKKSIIRILKESGFKIEKIQGINSGKVKNKLIFPLYKFMTFIFGRDTEFLHFGVRAKL